MSEDKLVPNIRFKGFEEEWRKDAISNIAVVTTGNTPSTNKKQYYSTIGIPWVTPSNIDKEGNIFDEKHLSEQGVKIARIVPKGSVLVTSIASIGKNTLVKTNTAFNQQINAITPKGNFDSYFIYISSIEMSKKMKTIASEGTMQIVNKREFSEMEIQFPSIPEQQKIGDLFAKLDRLLDLRQQKLYQLELLKKALLQKLFTKQDAKIPGLRFKGFEEEWGKENLSHMAPVRGGFAFSSSNFLKRGIPIIRISNILPEGKTGGEYVYYSKIKNDDSFSLKRGDCVIAMSGATTGKSSIIKDKFDTYYQNQRVGLFQHNENYYYKFVVTLIKSNNFLAQLKRVLIQGAQPNVSASEIDSFIFSIPKEYGEQQKIGNLLAKVDRLIELENKKFDNLKKVKKSLLQNMFVE